MPKEEILAMEAGELRRKVGEEVFGYTVEVRKGFRSFVDGAFVDMELPQAEDGTRALCYVADKWRRKDGEEVLVWEELPDYPKDISAAWQVVEKLTEEWTKKKNPISIEVIYDCGAYETKIETWNKNKECWDEPVFSSSCETAPEAICKVALLTKLEGGGANKK